MSYCAALKSAAVLQFHGDRQTQQQTELHLRGVWHGPAPPSGGGQTTVLRILGTNQRLEKDETLSYPHNHLMG